VRARHSPFESLVTAVAQRVPIVIVLVDNHGYASIGALSRSVGSSGFGTLYRFSDNGSVPLDPASTDVLPIDLAANAESLGAHVIRTKTIADLRDALAGARGAKELTVDASDTARGFFEKRGYTAKSRNTVLLNGEWLANTTMVKPLAAKEATKESAP